MPTTFILQPKGYTHGSDARLVELDVWLAFLRDDPELRHRTEPFAFTNPITNVETVFRVRPGQSELLVEGEWVPFVRYYEGWGQLLIDQGGGLEDPDHPAGRKFEQIVRHFDAEIAGDTFSEIFDSLL